MVKTFSQWDCPVRKGYPYDIFKMQNSPMVKGDEIHRGSPKPPLWGGMKRINI